MSRIIRSAVPLPTIPPADPLVYVSDEVIQLAIYALWAIHGHYKDQYRAEYSSAADAFAAALFALPDDEARKDLARATIEAHSQKVATDTTTTERALIRAATKMQADDKSKFNKTGAPVKRDGQTGDLLEVTPRQWKRANGE